MPPKGFHSRFTGRCSTCRQPYPIGERVTTTTASTVTPPEFAHYPTCPPRPGGVPDDPEAHYPARIGTHREDGTRTHAPPGEVCAGCSDLDSGRWVPVSDCSIAWAKAEAAGHLTPRWLT